jgi:phage protein D
MTNPTELASQVKVKIGGADAPAEVMGNLTALAVDQHTHLPGMFTLRFTDPALEFLDGGPFDLTKEVEILAEKPGGDPVSLIKADITALEPEFKEGMLAELVVRGYDASHRLYREKKSRASLNVKDSDLANRIAGEAGLTAQVEATSTVYEHVFQHNQSDLEFLMQRAWRIGFECFVEAGKLYFRKPPESPAAVTLTWGDDLLTFSPRMTLAEQVDEVVVRGWDPEKQTAIVGRAQRGRLYPEVGESKDGAGWAQTFGSGKLVIVDMPVVSQAEADALAAARLDEISGAFIEAEGEALRRPDIRAGQVIKLEALGDRFSGSYLVTSATHLFSPAGLRTRFSVRGTRTGLISEGMLHTDPLDRWPGVVTAVVTNTDDPKKQGRVKVKFPWLAEDAESDWARVMGAGAGPEAGEVAIPDVNDEVLVAFVHSDFSQPYVLGGLWNGKNPLPPEAAKAAGTEMALVRAWHSRKNHRMVMYDTSEKKIEIVTSDGRSVTLSDKDAKIIIKTSRVEVTLEDSKLTVQSGGDVSVKAGANLKLEASGNVDIQAGGQVTVKGAMINLN